jgi:hypothetical protein
MEPSPRMHLAIPLYTMSSHITAHHKEEPILVPNKPDPRHIIFVIESMELHREECIVLQSLPEHKSSRRKN